MGKKLNRISALLLSVLLIAALLPTTAFAAGKIDTEQPITLTIHYQNNGKNISGAKYSIYKVAEVDAYAEMKLVEPFIRLKDKVDGLSALKEMKSDEDWQTLASTLKSRESEFSAAKVDSGATDENGKLVFNEFDDLKSGLYLVIGSSRTLGSYIYSVVPFMVFLPGANHESNEWTYDVSVEPKSSRRSVPSGDDDTVTRKVLKVWEDGENESDRPEEIVVQLFRNSHDKNPYDTVTLNRKNNWSHTWNNLSDRYEWSITEKEVPDGYKMKVERNGVTFVITNTYLEDIPEEPTPLDPDDPSVPDNPPEEQPDDPGSTDEPPEDPGPLPTLPQTGVLWWPVPILLCLGMSFLMIGKAQRKGEKK